MAHSDRSPGTHPSTEAGAGLAFALILIGANLRAPITALGPVLPDIQRDLRLDGLGAGLLNALPLLAFGALSLVAPGVGRRYGLERTLGVALLCIFVGTVLRSLPGPGWVWAGTLVLSAGIAFGNVLLPGLVKRDFPHQAARIIGFYAAAMAGMAGVAVGLAVPIAHVGGSSWRWSIGGWALLALATMLVWIPHWKRSRQPLPGAADAVRTQRRSPWRHPIGWQVSLFFAAHSLVFYALIDWYASYAASRGVAAGTSGVYLLVYQVVAVATNLASASLIGRFQDQTRLGLACGLTLVVGTLGLLLAPDYSLLWLVCAGLGAGIAMVTSLSLFALRTRDHHQAAALSGMAQCIGYLGAATGPLIVGVLHDLTRGWTLPLLFLVLASVLVTLFATLAGRDRVID
ncbi:MFS transporter [Xanthomonas arboricola pv. juglandis]|uniref:CynX/NimT family MFS transporter n=1 Tax=Xanthomonas TaxID=338 RepID=UPI000E898E4C|nr:MULTISPECIES: MFS transporter [Xanthomonas]SYZ51410.1 MFS transporter [Xanthomonas arboricola pv. juglandis]